MKKEIMARPKIFLFGVAMIALLASGHALMAVMILLIWIFL